MINLQKFLFDNKIDFAFFLNSELNKRDNSVFYFTGVDPEFACLVVPNKNPPFLVVSKMEVERIRKATKVKLRIYEKKLYETIKREVGKAESIGVNFDILSLREFKSLRKTFKRTKIIDISKIVDESRIIKGKEEILKIKKACSITDKIFLKIISDFKFKTESEIEEFIEKESRENNCRLAFPPIVASGSNSSIPHYEKNDSRLKNGFCVMDFGVRYKGYNSDMTRTIYIGKPSDKEIEEYNRLLGVQKEAIRQLKQGVDFKKVDEGVRKVLKEPFMHGLGHGLGIDVHEPITTDKKTAILKAGTVLTVEPGVYYPGKYGIRIEDDVLITKKGCEVLTKSEKELVVVIPPTL